jgi:hypothetical protein
MTQQTQWTLILGLGMVLVNICGGMLIGPANTCFTLMAFASAVLISGYLQGKGNLAGKGVWAGGVTGAILGLVNLVSQSVGAMLFGLLLTGVVSLSNVQKELDPTILKQGASLGVWLLAGFLLIKGLLFIVGGAGLGALAAGIGKPRK